eukprot:1148392-Pelagomonas_calceolata.AAC.5
MGSPGPWLVALQAYFTHCSFWRFAVCASLEKLPAVAYGLHDPHDLLLLMACALLDQQCRQLGWKGVAMQVAIIGAAMQTTRMEQQCNRRGAVMQMTRSSDADD